MIMVFRIHFNYKVPDFQAIFIREYKSNRIANGRWISTGQVCGIVCITKPALFCLQGNNKYMPIHVFVTFGDVSEVPWRKTMKVAMPFFVARIDGSSCHRPLVSQLWRFFLAYFSCVRVLGSGRQCVLLTATLRRGMGRRNLLPATKFHVPITAKKERSTLNMQAWVRDPSKTAVMNDVHRRRHAGQAVRYSTRLR
jgi:hypothetical protein